MDGLWILALALLLVGVLGSRGRPVRRGPPPRPPRPWPARDAGTER